MLGLLAGCLDLLIAYSPCATAFPVYSRNCQAENSSRLNDNSPPEFVPVRIKAVGIGQRIFFGLGAIDQESDEIRIEVVTKPESAKYNERTLTVDWTPTADDDPDGRFVIRVSETRQDTGTTRTLTSKFSIPVQQNPVPLPKLDPAPLEVEALVSITDPERLEGVNKQWTLVRMFQRIAEIEAEKQLGDDSDVKTATGESLFRDALKELAKLHGNDSIDPDSPSFDPAWNAEHWRLICLRPRINKKVFELRFVYFNVKAAEQVYLMPRMRIIRGNDHELTDEIRQANNLAYIRMFHNAFFDGPNLKPFVANDKAKFSEVLAQFVTEYLNFSDPQHPQLRANFAALPHNARLGGGNRYDANGKYVSGDGWALGAMKVAPVERDGIKTLAITSPAIAGFVTSIKPSPDNTKFKPVPAPHFVAGSDCFETGFDSLVTPAGTVGITLTTSDGKVTAANLDAATIARDHKRKFMVSETPLDDPRRRLFEENGMTCIQCHVRNFDEGRYLVSVQKPDENLRAAWTQRIPTVFFVITPTDHDGRSEYIRLEEEEQVGNLKGVLKDYLQIEANLHTPLVDEWPHPTRNGRS